MHHAGIAEGYKSVFNGKDSQGWHISRSSHQGTTPSVVIKKGVLELRQNPFGQGGVLLSDKKYRDFELSLEVKIDSFSNGGIFLRSTESGQAYQIELSEPGGTGNLYGERLEISRTAEADLIKARWKAGDWNHFRIRMEGAVPVISVWINYEWMYTVTQTQNDFTAGAVEGYIGFQVHWSATFTAEAKAFDMSASWKPGAVHRFRNIFIKEL